MNNAFCFFLIHRWKPIVERLKRSEMVWSNILGWYPRFIKITGYRCERCGAEKGADHE